ncbi:aspartate--ammonia ligase [Christensenellaceae bacterium OttesenSCG-928-M15]|nr:aspartate--ammonia ligase [Christensenellaceae bacterium OttesenSCG-928-M15]
MNRIKIPDGYKSTLTLYETQNAIALIKRSFQDTLSAALNLKRVSAPLFVDPKTGLNDNLSGIERPVHFHVPAADITAEVVHSLAKWKRMALYRYDFHPGKGLYTDMNAIRRDEELDNLHSIYVDQWDWEKVILPEERHVTYLKQTVQSIVTCIAHTLDTVRAHYHAVNTQIKREVSFITTQELEDQYPDCTPEEREYHYVRDHGTAFVMQIGGALRSGEPHQGRAPDYDDWALNGDILFYYPVLDCVMEISSMGIRVDREALDRQLTIANADDRRELEFHSLLLKDKLPLTIGGGIGQSRLCMLLLGKAHVGEVQCSIWDEQTLSACDDAGIVLL